MIGERYRVPVTPAETSAVRDAFERAQAGDYRAAEAILAEGPRGDAREAAWRAALQALLHVAAPELWAAPEVPPETAETTAPRAVVLAQRMREALLSHSFEALAAWGDQLTPRPQVDLGVVALARGELEEARTRFETLRRGAKDPSVVVDAAAFGAFAALALGDVDDAVGRARRASRMARTESLLSCEYLANAILARARRHAGSPHLATRILGQLLSVVPSTWRPWLSYELALAGGEPDAHETDRAVAAVLGAARSGDRGRFGESAAHYLARLSGFAPLHREARAIVNALDPDAPPECAFALGTEALSPHGMVDPREGDGPVAYVVMRAPGRARRILAAGRGLVAEAVWEPPASAAPEVRGLTLLAVLALEPVIEIDDAFAAVYGFPYTSAKHEAVMRTLLHRTRTILGDAGAIERAGTTLSLHAKRPLLLPDPRSRRPPEQRVLAALARENGAVSAKDLAASLRVPLRTVQLALKQLVDDGAARQQRDGRRVEYLVEDSAFAEPSLTRLARRPRGRAD